MCNHNRARRGNPTVLGRKGAQWDHDARRGWRRPNVLYVTGLAERREIHVLTTETYRFPVEECIARPARYFTLGARGFESRSAPQAKALGGSRGAQKPGLHWRRNRVLWRLRIEPAWST